MIGVAAVVRDDDRRSTPRPETANDVISKLVEKEVRRSYEVPYFPQVPTVRETGKV